MRIEPLAATGERPTSFRSRRHRSILLPLFTVVAIDAVGAGILLPLLPLYATGFGATPVTIGMLVAIFSLCQFVSAPMFGVASDRLGRKRLLVASQIGTAASFVLMAVAPSLLILFVARILDGLTSGNVAIAAAYASDQRDPGKRRQAIGVVSAAMGVGTMVGPALGGALAPIGMALPFVAAAAISLVSIIATIMLLPADRMAPAHIEPATDTPQPVTPVRLLPQLRALTAVPGVPGLLVILSIFYLAFGLFTSQLALVLHARFAWHGAAFGPAQIGLVLTGASLVSIAVQFLLVRPLGALLRDRGLASLAFVLLAAGFVPLGFGHSFPALIFGVFGIALGSALVRPAIISSLSIAVPANGQGAVMGVSQALGSLINVAAPIVGGFMIQAQRYAFWATTMGVLALAGALVTHLVALIGRQRLQRRS